MVSKRHIIIDGWNVVRSTPDMERIFLKRGLDAAREELWRIVGPMHDYGGTRITIVYDGSGSDISVVRRNSIDTLAEVFTPSHMTADELIEQLWRGFLCARPFRIANPRCSAPRRNNIEAYEKAAQAPRLDYRKGRLQKDRRICKGGFLKLSAKKE